MAGEALYPPKDVLNNIVEHLDVLLRNNDEQVDVAVWDPELAGKRANELDSTVELCRNSKDLSIEGVEASPCFLVFIINLLGDLYHFFGNSKVIDLLLVLGARFFFKGFLILRLEVPEILLLILVS